jgi:hypothetical protein
VSDAPPRLPDGLFERLRADPWRAPESLALAARTQHGPAAAAWLARQPARRRRPRRLARRLVRRHARWGRLSGAVAGIGGAITMAPDLATLAWLQARMVFFIAAAYGHDPSDPDRAAELLVLQGLHHDVAEARASLDGHGTSVASSWIDRRLSRDEALLRALVSLAARTGGKHLLGKSIPGFAIFYGSWANARATRHLGRAAIRFYDR